MQPRTQVWTLVVEALDEARATRWRAVLDPHERRRADGMALRSRRVEFIAAHALLRAALSRFDGHRPTAFRLVADASGKPGAWLGAEPAPLSFSLSHADRMVGVVVTGPGRSVGFDLEPLARPVPPGVAERFFAPAEVRWLDTLPDSARAHAFLRLWTLKEAYIKATGSSLAGGLHAFSFDLLADRIRLAADAAAREGDWWFEQRVLCGTFLAALALRDTTPAVTGRGQMDLTETDWISIDASRLDSLLS